MLERARIVDQVRGLGLLAGLCGSAIGCVHTPTASSPAPAIAPASTGQTQRAAVPPTIAAYCDAASKRREAFTPNVHLEVLSASLVPRAGDEPRILTPAEQEGFRTPQLFVSRTSIVSAADIEAAEIRPATMLPEGGYEVLVFGNTPAAAEQRWLPMVGGLVAFFVDGRLVALPQLLAAEIKSFSFSVSTHLTLPEALASASRFNPPVDIAGLKKLEKRCLDGEAAFCVPLAEERLTGRDAPYDTYRASLLFEKACALGLGAACERAAGLALNTHEATELLQRGCQSNHPNACFKLGELLLKQTSSASRIAQGKANLTLACDQGVGRGCTALADLLERDYPGQASPPPDVQKSFLRLLERGCTGGDGSACFTLAQISRRGNTDPADMAAAKRWLHAGCVLDPTGGGLFVAIRFGSEEQSLTSDLAEAGCTNELPPPPPLRRALCTTMTAQ